MSRRIDLTGHVFGRFTVVGPAQVGPRGQARAICRCSCGKERIVYQYSLSSGDSKSCGCLRADVPSPVRTHGHSRTRIYGIWHHMIDRCENSKHKHYANYGGRGIKVCGRWHDVTNFVADMGQPPDDHQIDRIDNDGDYCPENCKWSSRHDQNRNKRTNHWITHSDGRTMVLADWAESCGVSPTRIVERIATGWPVDLALTAPSGTRYNAYGAVKGHPGKRDYPKKC